MDQPVVGDLPRDAPPAPRTSRGVVTGLSLVLLWTAAFTGLVGSPAGTAPGPAAIASASAGAGAACDPKTDTDCAVDEDADDRPGGRVTPPVERGRPSAEPGSKAGGPATDADEDADADATGSAPGGRGTDADEDDRQGAATEDDGADSDSSDDDGGVPAWLVVVAGLVGAGLGAAAVLLLRRPPASPPVTAAPAPPPVAPTPSPTASDDRRALVTAAIEVRDLVPSEALRERLAQALRDAGVEEVRADGEPFDPDRHVAVDRVPVADPAEHNRVAATERPGYVDRGRVVRLPEVVVHRRDDGS